MVSYWLHVIELNDSNLVYNAYSDKISRDTGFSHTIKLFLGKINFSHLWANQSTFSKAKLLHAVTVSYSQIKRFLYILLEKMLI